MSVEVVMPQMGESITEGTVSKWLKQVGEKVEKDEPLLEISTDKVDAEVPAPSAGVLLEIRAEEGETVEVNSIVGVLGEEGEAAISDSKSQMPDEEVQIEEATAEQPAPVIEQTQTATASTNSVNSENSTEVVMPQMGESITEGTVSKWLKAVGDKIEKDEPLLEISTDKVDAEVPSPVAGTLLEIRAEEGETVEVGSVVGLVGAEGAVAGGSQSATAAAGSQTSAAGQMQAEQQTAQATGAAISAPTSVSMPSEEKREIEES